MTSAPDPIRILTLADETYAMPLAVMGRSLLENHRSPRPLLLTVVDGGLTPESRARVEESWHEAACGSATWRWIPPAFGAARQLPVWGRMPALTYARLFLDEYLSGSGGRVVMLDSDTLVLGDISELHDAVLEQSVLGACVDPFIPTLASPGGLPHSARRGLARRAPYFNAGVMVVDLARWRQERVTERALAYIEREAGRLRQFDQDALNAVLAGQWKQLDQSWNVQPRARNALGTPPPDRTRIVHFSGRLKPWLYHSQTEADRVFRDYLARTGWSGFRVPDTMKARLWRWYDSPVRRVFYRVERSLSALQRNWRPRRLVQASTLGAWILLLTGPIIIGVRYALRLIA